MAAGQERQKPETFTQEVQEGREAAGRHTHTIRIKSNIDPEKAWLHDLSEENYKKLTPEQQREWIAYQQESIKRLPEALAHMKKTMSEIMKNIIDYQRQQGDSIKTAFESCADEISILRDRMIRLEQLEQLEPFIVEELKSPEYNGLEIPDLLEDLAGERKEPIPGEVWEKIIDGAGNRKIAAALPSVNVTRADIVEYPIDKINSKIWDMFTTDTNGQIKFAIPVQKSGAKSVIPVYYSINFDALESNMRITRRLTQLDKRIYIAINSLKSAGNDVVTTTQIHYAMGFVKRPNSEQLEKYREEIIKMIGAIVFLDNKEETESYNYPHFKYFGSLLPAEGVSCIVNGKVAENAIRILNELPLIRYAKQHKQITTIDIKYLQSPFNKTESNLKIEDYLLERISRAKNGKQPKKILKKTLFEKIEADDQKKKSRTLKTVEKFMQFYKESGYISDYNIDISGVSFCF